MRDDPWFDERDNEGNIIPPRIELIRGNNQRNKPTFGDYRKNFLQPTIL